MHFFLPISVYLQKQFLHPTRSKNILGHNFMLECKIDIFYFKSSVTLSFDSELPTIVVKQWGGGANNGGGGRANHVIHV